LHPQYDKEQRKYEEENMENERLKEVQKQRRKGMKNNGISGGIYGMAFIGAAVYYIQHAATFWAGVLGFFKALFWPAVLMYKLLGFLKM
jgi:hypothetical protein